MNECVQYFYKHTDCTRVEALEAATLHPAQMLHLDKVKGTLNHGADADIVMLDMDLTVKATYLAGRQVWHAPDHLSRTVRVQHD